jgi:hypothetical protein
LNEHSSRYQLASYWTGDDLLRLQAVGLRLDDLRVAREGNRIIACAALWDQRSFKQVVIRGYAGLFSWARPFLNLVSRISKGPQLPAIGATLPHAMVSHLAAPWDRPAVLVPLNKALYPIAHEKGIEFLTLGFAADDPLLATLRAGFACREYRSRLYTVSWPGMVTTPEALDDRLPFPDVALL